MEEVAVRQGIALSALRSAVMSRPPLPWRPARPGVRRRAELLKPTKEGGVRLKSLERVEVGGNDVLISWMASAHWWRALVDALTGSPGTIEKKVVNSR